MRDVMLLGSRLVLGAYLAVHGVQKLFGAFGGPGLDKAGAGFERIGLTPGKPMAALAGATELGGGLLTVAGVADPGRTARDNRRHDRRVRDSPCQRPACRQPRLRAAADQPGHRGCAGRFRASAGFGSARRSAGA